MKVYGILPKGFDIEKDPANPYELDRKYWKSLWYHPKSPQGGTSSQSTNGYWPGKISKANSRHGASVASQGLILGLKILVERLLYLPKAAIRLILQ